MYINELKSQLPLISVLTIKWVYCCSRSSRAAGTRQAERQIAVAAATHRTVCRVEYYSCHVLCFAPSTPWCRRCVSRCVQRLEYKGLWAACTRKDERLVHERLQSSPDMQGRHVCEVRAPGIGSSIVTASSSITRVIRYFLLQ
jgi:hypothetical protein